MPCDPVFDDTIWQMTLGERFALEGLLAKLKPRLAVEIGTAEGGSLRRLAEHSEEVHSFDINPAAAALEYEMANVHVHVGDSAETLPRVLAELAAKGRQVDFALVDGNHSRTGVQRDAQALLDSPACAATLIVFHDSANDEVRAGLEALALPSDPRVGLCMLDFVPGYLCVADHFAYPHAAWNGLGLVILGDRLGYVAERMRDYYSVAEIYQLARRTLESGFGAI